MRVRAHVRLVEWVGLTSMTDHAPSLWGSFYAQSAEDDSLAEITNSIRKLLETMGTSDLKELLKAFRPDIIICTHFLSIDVLLDLKREGQLPQPVYCVITDYVAHTFWTYPDIDGYFVGSHMVRDQLVERGVSPDIIQITGLPVDPKIAEPKDAAHERQQLDLPADKPVITLFGGGIPAEKIRKIVLSLLERAIEGQLVVAAGRNEKLLDALDDLQPGPHLGLRLLGYIDYVDSLITASDIVATKAGGLITSETLARSVPLVVFEPIPGHEEWNADFIVNCGAGMQLRKAESVPDAIAYLLSKPQVLQEMRKSADVVRRPRAAYTIAEYVLDRYRHAEHGVG
ncbi:MAG: galactosyldiacylglycerol synthase [Blastochloris sp.]|nr:galactosyldiacylglycerol synthase [Blastochloris sp.]